MSNLCEYRIPYSAFAMKANRGSSSSPVMLPTLLAVRSVTTKLRTEDPSPQGRTPRHEPCTRVYNPLHTVRLPT